MTVTIGITEEQEEARAKDPLDDRPDLLRASSVDLARMVMELEDIIRQQHAALKNIRQIALHQVGLDGSGHE